LALKKDLVWGELVGNSKVKNQNVKVRYPKVMVFYFARKEKLLIFCPTIYYIIMMFEEDFDIMAMPS